jgi:hypothetical protein
LQDKQEEAKKEVSVPADESQPTCALSGERFETFWDDASEQWCYRDAVRLDADQAARYWHAAHTYASAESTSRSTGGRCRASSQCLSSASLLGVFRNTWQLVTI